MQTFSKKGIGCFIAVMCIYMMSAFAQNDTPDPYVQPNPPAKEEENKKSKAKEDFVEKLQFGGSFGAFFGQQTYIELSPKVGYKVNDRLVAGLGLNYIYFSIKDYGQKFVTHIYGPTVFAQYALVSGLFAYGEFNAYNVASYNPLPPYNSERIWIGSAPIGLGYYSGGEIGGVYIAVLYDLINNPYSPYYNGSVPILFRVGFLF
ncbi:MAG TPA: hypothetical protein PK323_06135 [Bacteroidia bacterium]|nr:hypothetical protein [Bacteroidia bacterium]